MMWSKSPTICFTFLTGWPEQCTESMLITMNLCSILVSGTRTYLEAMFESPPYRLEFEKDLGTFIMPTRGAQ